MLALVDANNFYVSCERAFNPALEGKPVGVLSNNDGCIIARSNELKPWVKMGTPLFQLEELRKTQEIKLFSSNYALYGDMSSRIVATLNRFVEEVEVYSIDEAFLNLSGYEQVYPDLTAFARQLRATVRQWTRIPTSVGLAPTKTLCKVANWYAKRQPEQEGVLLLDDPGQVDAALREFDVADLWGVGWRYEGMLKRAGIRTAAQLRDLPDDWLADRMTVNGLRLAYELRGVPCKLLETEASAKKAICTAPSFGKGIHDYDTIRQAMTTHLSRATEKLRRQESAAGAITVFLHTNRYKRSPNGELAKQYHSSRTVLLPHPTSSTSELVAYAQAALKTVYKFGYEYQKIGVYLTDLVPANYQQPGLFADVPDGRSGKLFAAVDKLNQRYGRDKVRLAAAGYDPSWHHKRQWLSPRYTTQWKEILTIT